MIGHIKGINRSQQSPPASYDGHPDYQRNNLAASYLQMFFDVHVFISLSS